MTGLRTVEEQQATVLAAVHPLPAETLPLGAAAGRTLAAPVRAAVDIPAFDNSAMDGFAVRAADVAHARAEQPVPLRVVADLPAGTPDDPALSPGEAARIMTGSPVPTDADAVVPFEDTVGGLADSLDTVTVLAAPRAAAHIRRRGEDARTGDVILPAGVALGAWQLSAAAAAGVAEVEVARAPRVAIVSTGSELVEPGRPLRRGQIPESNSILLAALARAAGGDVVARESVDDDGEGLRTVLAAVTGGPSPADVVVFSGGVSAGAYEVVKNELAGTMAFSKVAMQPGKPQGFGVLPGGTLLFGLPGNPVSAAVSFEVFVRPALLALQGRTDIARPVLQLPAAAAWRTPPARRQYLPAVIDRTDPSRWTVRPASAGGSGSHLAGGLGAAEALAVVPAETDAVAAGDFVNVLLLG
ncbi:MULTISPECIES: molybdopterin molybdotransferase MoeA [Microbacterium]|uniref:Molybdopterin molybdenumtransferase n=1 Tax=Microbacterium saccharophilum TaxID=1213358 RepID=A0A7Z7CZ29_9MICO|nr:MULTISPECIES: gephyrin-like molybdotransferase Glp [Microbacterium]SFI18753.1 molybdopterin molybdotransferase [Microbacterium saccharophilum]